MAPRPLLLLLPLSLGLLSLLVSTPVAAVPDKDCPEYLRRSGNANDLASLSYEVSQPPKPLQLICGGYTPLETVEGKYDTRMRIYRQERTGDTVVVFRFTVQPTGEIIHTNRTMANCTFLSPNPFSAGEDGRCMGRVHDRFQVGFVSLVQGVKDWDQYLDGVHEGKRRVLVTGTSLGGALQLFMGLWLFHVKGIKPATSLGIAGTFIGDRAFADCYQIPYKQTMQDCWWQTESVNKRNASQYDDVAESYQAPPKGHEIYVMRDALCAMKVTPLKIPEEAFGMHDLRQYHLFLNGTDCNI